MAHYDRRVIIRLAAVAGICHFLVASSAQAQVGEITGALSNAFMQGEYVTRHHVGWVGAVEFPVTQPVSIVAEGSGEYSHDPYHNSFRFYTLLAGPKFTESSSGVRAFVQLPIGLIRFRTIFRSGAPLSYANNFWLFAPGGGVDVPIHDHLAARLAADWLIVGPQYGLSWRQHDVRLVTGVTYRP